MSPRFLADAVRSPGFLNWSSVLAGRMGIAIAQAFGLARLGQISPRWHDTFVVVPVWVVAIVVPVVLVVGLGRMRLGALLVWAAMAAAVLAVLGLHAVDRMYYEHQFVGDTWPAPLFWVAVAGGGFSMQFLIEETSFASSKGVWVFLRKNIRPICWLVGSVAMFTLFLGGVGFLTLPSISKFIQIIVFLLFLIIGLSLYIVLSFLPFTIIEDVSLTSFEKILDFLRRNLRLISWLAGSMFVVSFVLGSVGLVGLPGSGIIEQIILFIFFILFLTLALPLYFIWNFLPFTILAALAGLMAWSIWWSPSEAGPGRVLAVRSVRPLAATLGGALALIGAVWLGVAAIETTLGPFAWDEAGVAGRSELATQPSHNAFDLPSITDRARRQMDWIAGRGSDSQQGRRAERPLHPGKNGVMGRAPWSFVAFAFAFHLAERWRRPSMPRTVAATVSIGLAGVLMAGAAILVARSMGTLPAWLPQDLDTSWKIGGAAVLVPLVNWIHHQGRVAERLQRTAQLALVSGMAILVTSAAVDIHVEHAASGLSIRLVVEEAILTVLACCAVGYGFASVDTTGRTRDMRLTNLFTAHVAVAMVLLLLSPAGDPARLTVADQYDHHFAGTSMFDTNTSAAERLVMQAASSVGTRWGMAMISRLMG